MPKLVVSNAALVRLQWNQSLTVYMNVLGALVGGGTVISQALANTLDSAIKAAFTSSGLVAQFHSTTALNFVAIRSIQSPDQPEYIGSGAGVVGTGTGDPLPLANALCYTLRTTLAGRTHRGRIYLSGYTESANDTTGRAAAAAGTASLAFINAIATAFSNNGLTLAVVSRPSERVQIVKTTFHADGTTTVNTKTHDARPGGVLGISSIQQRNLIWDTQRRRASVGSSSTLALAAQPPSSNVTIHL